MLYNALANQTSLQSLVLREDLLFDPQDTDALSESLSKLVNLTNLLTGILYSSPAGCQNWKCCRQAH